LNLANLTVESGGKVSADGTGYPGRHESGTGPGAGASAWATGGGGGHGAKGQNAAGSGGNAYDSAARPVLPGSSGGAGQDIYHSVLPGGAGGGAMWLSVSDTLAVNGTISADGVIGAARSGGGSGGSILVEATNLVGAGSIHANGGPQNGGGNGAGGRIAVYTSNANHTITFAANGAPGYETAGKGSIFFDFLDLSNSTVDISPAEVAANGSSAATVTVTLKNVDGYPMPDKPVQIAVVSGQGVTINGQAAGPTSYVNIGITDENGIVTATLTTKQIGARTIQARSAGETIMDTGAVEFIAPTSGAVIQDKSVASSGNESTDCIGCSVNNTQGNVGGPINTRTGAYDYKATDLSFVTSAGELSFVRTYSSFALDLPTNVSPGWTHNQDMRLIFEGDPGGEPGVVLLKSRSANEYYFYKNADGTYQAAEGIHATLIRDSATQYTVKDSNQNVYVFDGSGKIVTFTNPQGHTWGYDYNANGYLDRVTANGGASHMAFAYDAQGRMVSVTDHSGRSISFAYDSLGDLKTFTDVLRQTWTYAYDNAHRMTQVTAPDQSIVERTEYDSQGRAVRQYDGENNLVVELIYNADGTTTVKDALGNEQTHAYDARGTLIGKTDGVGAETITVYDENFQPIKVTNAAGHVLSMTWSADGVNLLSKTDPAGNVTSNTYDALNNLTSTTDPQGNTTQYAYSGKLLTTSTDALGGETTYAYTPEGYLASTTDSAGRTTRYTYTAFGLRASMIDADGNTWTYAYDALGRLTDTTDPRGRVAHVEYNVAGQILHSVQNYSPARAQNAEDVYNIVTEYEYNARGKPAKVTDTFGNATQYVYDHAGRLTQTIDALGNTTTNIYDAAGKLSSTKDALGNETRYVYDATGRLVNTINALGVSADTTTFDVSVNTSTVTNATGAKTTFYYDELGRVIKTVDALDNATSITYDANGNVAARTDTLNRVTRYEYDALNRLVKTIDPLGGVVETIYNDKGQGIASVDSLGNRTEYEYDEFGRLIATTDLLGRITRTEYDQYGRRTASIDATGKRTAYEYDLLDRVVATTDPLGNITRATYDALGNVLTRTDANGGVTHYAYDNLNRVIATTDASGNTATNQYDAAGNLISMRNPLGAETRYEYDALNRRVAVIDSAGNAERTYYDALGQIVGAQDANGVVTHFEYDALGRQTAVVLNYSPTVPANAETNVRYGYEYNAVGNRIAATDSKGGVTRYAYDELNRVTAKTDPVGNTWRYEYDAAGNKIGLTDGNGQVTQYAYDATRQLTSITYADQTVSFTYSPTGQRLTMTDGLGVTSWTYDDLNRVVETKDPYDQIVQYGYDSAGNRTSLTYPNGMRVSYVYNDANLLTEVLSDQTSVVRYQYDAANRVSEVNRANGVLSTYEYDSAGRVVHLVHSNAQGLLADYQYTYDPAGNVSQVVENVGKPIPPTTVPTHTSVPTETPTETATQTATPEPTATETATETATPEITATPELSPADLLAALRASVVSYADNGQIDAKAKNSLLSKVDAAIKGEANGKINSVINQLGAFTNEAQAQRGKKIEAAAADDLIAQAQLIIVALSATPAPALTLTSIPANTETALPVETIAPTQIPSAAPTFMEIPSPTFTSLPETTPTETLIPAETFTLAPDITATTTETGIQPAGPLTINYQYDSLRRLKSAEYSDGRRFTYAYDANGNVLEANASSTITTYAYDAANQLVTAQKDLTTWNYLYDGNGSLIKVLPNGDETSGAKRYAYNPAGYLIKVEEHDGSAWNVQSEMSYNGLGERLNMTVSALGQSASTRYVLDAQQYAAPLIATSDGKDTIFLYGFAPIAEKNDAPSISSHAWNYLLADVSNTPRQLADQNGSVTLFARYDPQGNTLDLDGKGNFTFGYFGGLMDEVTGLIYIGDGQYYDPVTGRFITRGANPNSPNPYIPDPTGLLIAPLGLMGVAYSGKSKKSAPYVLMLVMLVVLPLSVGMACSIFGGGGNNGAGSMSAPPNNSNNVVSNVVNQVSTAPATVAPVVPTSTATPTQAPAPVLCASSIPLAGAPFDPARANETILNAAERKEAFLQAVLRHQNELPSGMTVPLFLAMGSAEKGVCSNWSQVHDPCNPGNADGIMQISPDNAWRYHSGYAYNDTYGGFEGNVQDAILFLRDIAANYRREGIEKTFGGLPSGDSVKILLYYNAGHNPIVEYANGGGNQQYLSQVARYLEDSPFGCQYVDLKLASDLRAAQIVLDDRVKEYIATGQ